MTTRTITRALACVAIAVGVAAGAPFAAYVSPHHYRIKDVPTVTSCGSGAAVTGVDESGIVTFSAATTTCTVTFADSWSDVTIGGTGVTAMPPICTATLDTAAPVGISSVSLTAITFVFASKGAGEKLYFHCGGWME